MFELAATASLGFITAIWSQDGFVNVGIKCVFLGMSLWGAVEAAHAFNFFSQ